MEFIKNILRKLYAKKTGACCGICAHNDGGKCTRSQEEFSACWPSISRPGFAPIQAQPVAGDLTPEEQHQMEKIISALQEAETTARDGGLLGGDWEDKPTSGLIEED